MYWFGVAFIIPIEIGYMTPPFGFRLFSLMAMAAVEITIFRIYSTVIP